MSITPEEVKHRIEFGSKTFYALSAVLVLLIILLAWWSFRMENQQDQIGQSSISNNASSNDDAGHSNLLESTLPRKTDEGGKVSIREMKGMVISVTPDKRSFRFAEKDGQVYSVGISPETKVTQDGEPAQITDTVRYGDTVVTASELLDTEKYDFFAESVLLPSATRTPEEVRAELELIQSKSSNTPSE